MAIKDVFKVSLRTFFNPTAWLGANTLKLSTSVFWGMMRGLFIVPKPERQENFNEAMQRFQHTEESLEALAQSYLTYAIIFIVIAALTFSLGFYFLFEYHTIYGWISCMLVTTLLFLQAFRYHFWYFQIKQRKLGCTFQEWWHGKVVKGPKHD